MAKPGRARSEPRLRALIAEAIVDAYNEYEQATGFLTMIEQHVRCPFEALVVGATVHVRRFDIGERGQVIAVCRRRESDYRVDVTALEWEDAPPPGSEWIQAYRAWLNGGY